MMNKTPSHIPGPSTWRLERAWKSTLLSVTGVAKGGRGTEETDTAALVTAGTAKQPCTQAVGDFHTNENTQEYCNLSFPTLADKDLICDWQ